MKLENWAITSDPYKAPELNVRYLSGNVYNHPVKEDGKSITTSRLLRVISVDGKMFAKTKSGSIYELGTVDAKYEEMFPGAVDRIIKAYSEESVRIRESECYRKMVEIITEAQGIRGTELVINEAFRAYESTEIHECMAALEDFRDVVILEYTLPTMDYRQKSMYFPKGTLATVK